MKRLMQAISGAVPAAVAFRMIKEEMRTMDTCEVQKRKRKGITNDDAIYIWDMINVHGLPEDFYEFATSCGIDPEDAYVVLDEIGKFVHSHDWYGATSRDE